jgi:hypothetical protein
LTYCWTLNIVVMLTFNGLHVVVSQKIVKVKVKVTLRLTVGQSVCLGVEPRLGLMTRYLFTV